MGKVMINETDATKTARNGSSNESLREKRKGERAHVDVSRGSEKAKDTKVKVNTNDKTGNAKGSQQRLDSGRPKSDSKAIAVRSESKKSSVDNKSKEAKTQKSPQISRYAKPKADKTSEVKIIAKETLTRSAKTTADSKAAEKPEMGLVVRGVDPEIALMASRAKAMEKVKPGMNRGGKSMSGMVVEGVRPMGGPRGTRTGIDRNGRPIAEVKTATIAAEKEPEEESKYARVKSMLIGVGVALVVAVVGFAGIAIFGNNKNMCTIHFESNGGSTVEGTEIVCGRKVVQPDDPEKEGFSFEGWMLEGEAFNFDSTPLYKNSTLVAKWKANDGTEVVTVKFDTDGGSTIAATELAKGSKLQLPSTPTKIGYVFEDWYLNDKPYDFSQPVESDMTLKAKWEKRETSSSTSSNGTKTPQVTGITVKNLSVEEGQTATQTVTVLPSAAEYSLSVTSAAESIATCAISNKNVVSCTGKLAGSAVIRVRDVNSGQSAQFTVTVTEKRQLVDDKPDVNPGEEHKHTYVDGVCTGCGESDPNYVAPEPPVTPDPPKHEHTYVDGTCTGCGEKDPDYVPPHTHTYENGVCTGCGAADPNYVPPSEGGDENAGVE